MPIIQPFDDDAARRLAAQVRRLEAELAMVRRILRAFQCQLDDAAAATGKKPFCWFYTAAAFTTGSAYVSGYISEQWGEGEAHATANPFNFYNLPRHDSSYEFYGDSGDRGAATYDPVTNTWAIFMFECP